MANATMTVKDLRAACQNYGLPTNGKKDELIKRLESVGAFDGLPQTERPNVRITADRSGILNRHLTNAEERLGKAYSRTAIAKSLGLSSTTLKAASAALEGSRMGVYWSARRTNDPEKALQHLQRVETAIVGEHDQVSNV